MPLELKVQFNIIFYALAAGVMIGIFFDLYRMIRGKGGHKLIIIVQDVLFWLLSAILVFTFLLYTNYAFLGPYVYLCMGVSLFIYLKLFSNFIYKVENGIVYCTKSTIRRGYKNISYPFRLFFSKFNNKR
ncbi:MAG: spore cortex biosynthesis protein YabQ [Clostridium sp.]|uniref:spore cortex biosynthesis protein YabQ n=1 Tax=Clostridium sp. TaxID=1506 RepID=UPI003F2D19DD